NSIGQLDNIYRTQNAPAFSGAIGAVTPGGLQTAQNARVATNTGNIVAPSASGPANEPLPPISSDAPPAEASERNAALKSAFDFTNNAATAQGKLGGFSDQWFNSDLAKQDAARKIGVANSNANNIKSLIGPEQDLAAAAAYRPPSPWGSLLSGTGNL